MKKLCLLFFCLLFFSFTKAENCSLPSSDVMNSFVWNRDNNWVPSNNICDIDLSEQVTKEQLTRLLVTYGLSYYCLHIDETKKCSYDLGDSGFKEYVVLSCQSGIENIADGQYIASRFVKQSDIIIGLSRIALLDEKYLLEEDTELYVYYEIALAKGILQVSDIDPNKNITREDVFGFFYKFSQSKNSNSCSTVIQPLLTSLFSDSYTGENTSASSDSGSSISIKPKISYKSMSEHTIPYVFKSSLDLYKNSIVSRIITTMKKDKIVSYRILKDTINSIQEAKNATQKKDIALYLKELALVLSGLLNKNTSTN